MGAISRDALLTGIKATVPAYSRDGRITERALKDRGARELPIRADIVMEFCS